MGGTDLHVVLPAPRGCALRKPFTDPHGHALGMHVADAPGHHRNRCPWGHSAGPGPGAPAQAGSCGAALWVSPPPATAPCWGSLSPLERKARGHTAGWWSPYLLEDPFGSKALGPGGSNLLGEHLGLTLLRTVHPDLGSGQRSPSLGWDTQAEMCPVDQPVIAEATVTRGHAARGLHSGSRPRHTLGACCMQSWGAESQPPSIALWGAWDPWCSFLRPMCSQHGRVQGLRGFYR